MVAPSPPPLDLLDLVDAAGVEQDPLAERGLARVDVGRDADVANFAKVHGRGALMAVSKESRRSAAPAACAMRRGCEPCVGQPRSEASRRSAASKLKEPRTAAADGPPGQGGYDPTFLRWGGRATSPKGVFLTVFGLADVRRPRLVLRRHRLGGSRKIAKGDFDYTRLLTTAVRRRTRTARVPGGALLRSMQPNDAGSSEITQAPEGAHRRRPHCPGGIWGRWLTACVRRCRFWCTCCSACSSRDRRRSPRRRPPTNWPPETSRQAPSISMASDATPTAPRSAPRTSSTTMATSRSRTVLPAGLHDQDRRDHRR